MAVKTLLVEDDDRIRAALRLALGEEGFEVVEASDVAEGLAAFEREQPDVLLVDVMLGNSDGRDLIREVRTRSQVPIIITSARGDTTTSSPDSKPAPTTTWSSRSWSKSWPRASARCGVVMRAVRTEEPPTDVVVLSDGPRG